jgi:hypothetical protein
VYHVDLRVTPRERQRSVWNEYADDVIDELAEIVSQPSSLEQVRARSILALRRARKSQPDRINRRLKASSKSK